MMASFAVDGREGVKTLCGDGSGALGGFWGDFEAVALSTRGNAFFTLGSAFVALDTTNAVVRRCQ